MSKEKRRVPKLRFPGFTEDWEQRKLGDVTNIKTGSRNQQDSVTNGQYPFFIRSEKIEKLDRYDFDTEAILVPGDGRIGEIFHYYNGKFALHQRVYKVDNFKGVDAFFLLYLFQCSFKEHALRLNAQGTVPSLRLPMFTEWNICIPSLQEQIGIGRLLNKIELMITLHQRKLDNLKLKKKALLQKLFPKNGEHYPELRFPGFTDAWEQRKFKDIAFKRGKISEADLPYVEFEDINSGIGTLNKNILQKVGHKKGILFETGDVLFGKLRPYLQNWLLCQFRGIAVGDFWVLQPQNVSSVFLYYLIQSEAYQSVANISSGTKMPRSSWSLVSETQFSIPKYNEANMIGEFFSSIDKNITLHQRKLDHLQLQKKALLQQMFV